MAPLDSYKSYSLPTGVSSQFLLSLVPVLNTIYFFLSVLYWAGWECLVSGVSEFTSFSTTDCGFGIWLFVIWLLISFFYVLSIHGAMQEVKETVPTIPVQNQQVYPTTPGPLGVEMGQHIDMQPKYDVEASAPPSYNELFPTMEQSSK